MERERKKENKKGMDIKNQHQRLKKWVVMCLLVEHGTVLPHGSNYTVVVVVAIASNRNEEIDEALFSSDM